MSRQTPASTFNRLYQGLVATGRSIIDILFPIECFNCRIKAQTAFCLTCRQRLPPAPPLSYPQQYAAIDYNHHLAKKLIWKLKYSHQRHAAEVCAELISERVVPELLGILKEYQTRKNGEATNLPFLVVPVPTDLKRQRERGYNQAWVIAQNLSYLHPSLFTPIDLLYRNRPTISQTKMKNRAERLTNLQNSFAVRDQYLSLIQDQTIIVIDDVITSGATTREAARALTAAGAKEVISLAVAHG